ncbi:MAG: enolase C-terminal domain-like protein [archaeon]
MAEITAIKLSKTRNSKKEQTIAATVYTKKSKATFAAPSGTSAGKHEAVFMPKPIDDVIKNAERNVVPALIGLDVEDQKSIDRTLIEVDGEHNFSSIGGSVSTAVSAACLKSAAVVQKKEPYALLSQRPYKMPKLLGVCIAGGKHAENSTTFQEFLSIPITDSVRTAVILNKRVHSLVGRKLKAKKRDFEGGWVKPGLTNEQALEIMSQAISETSDATRSSIALGVDFAASEFYSGGKYSYKTCKRNAREQLKYASELIEKYGIYFAEDAFNEDDYTSFATLTRLHGDVLVCGDDLFTTNAERLKHGIKKRACNSVIIKPNQIGTITQAEETVRLAQKHGYATVISHRSGENYDGLLADLCVGWKIPFMKIGIVGKERTAKTNRLMIIEKLEAKEKRV